MDNEELYSIIAPFVDKYEKRLGRDRLADTIEEGIALALDIFDAHSNNESHGKKPNLKYLIKTSIQGCVMSILEPGWEDEYNEENSAPLSTPTKKKATLALAPKSTAETETPIEKNQVTPEELAMIAEGMRELDTGTQYILVGRFAEDKSLDELAKELKIKFGKVHTIEKKGIKIFRWKIGVSKDKAKELLRYAQMSPPEEMYIDGFMSDLDEETQSILIEHHVEGKALTKIESKRSYSWIRKAEQKGLKALRNKFNMSEDRVKAVLKYSPPEETIPVAPATPLQHEPHESCRE